MTEKQKENPSLSTVIKSAIDAKLLETHTAIPGVIKKYDKDTQLADVQPAIKKKFIFKDEVEKLPQITNVPVQWPSANGGEAFIHLPLKPGDTGLLVFSERSIGDWILGEGDETTPTDPRKHDLSDAVFIPGVKPTKKAFAGASDDNIVIKNGDLVVEIAPSGKMSFTNSADEMIQVLSDLIQNLLDAKVITFIGPQPFWAVTVAALTATKNKLDSFLRS